MSIYKPRSPKLDLACGCCPPRRRVLAGLAAIGVGALVPQIPAAVAQTAAPAAKPRRINVHHHFTPPAYAELGSKGTAADQWSAEKSLADMDAAGITTSIHSNAGTDLGTGEKARRLARTANEFAAKLEADYPGRFGSFATLPMPDIDGSLAEVAYALDTLKADGIYLWTSYHGKYLGDPFFAPLFEELNRRKAVVFVHPVRSACCGNVVPGIPAAAIEYGTDTTRAIALSVFGGASRKYPDVKMIWSHAGGTMPFLIERFIFETKHAHQKDLPQGFEAEVAKFYYDTAQATNRIPMQGLKTLVPMSQILFGTDWPYRTSLEHVEGLKKSGVFNQAELTAIDWQNTAKILPRWA
jgi:predicted TIM-barrel fold metal-dependent hydrolase